MKASISVNIEFRELPMDKKEAATVIAQLTQQLATSVNSQNPHVRVRATTRIEALRQLELHQAK